ncbi:MAG: hypothetical protein ACRDGD_13120 [Candidatus Limnocylindria bacterium]
MRRPAFTVLLVVVGLLLLADLLVVNPALEQITEPLLDAVILVAAGAALAGVASLALRRGSDLWRRRGDPVAALLVIGGMLAVLVAGLRPGSTGAADPAVAWIVSALIVPIGATLFGLLFVTTLAAARRSAHGHGRESTLLVAAAVVTVVLLLPLGGELGGWLSAVAAWALAVPIGAAFRGLLIGVAVLAALVAARTILGIGPADE